MTISSLNHRVGARLPGPGNFNSIVPPVREHSGIAWVGRRYPKPERCLWPDCRSLNHHEIYCVRHRAMFRREMGVARAPAWSEMALRIPYPYKITYQRYQGRVYVISLLMPFKPNKTACKKLNAVIAARLDAPRTHWTEDAAAELRAPAFSRYFEFVRRYKASQFQCHSRDSEKIRLPSRHASKRAIQRGPRI